MLEARSIDIVMIDLLRAGGITQWTLQLFEETPALERGELVVPCRPGLGLAFDRTALKRYQVG